MSKMHRVITALLMIMAVTAAGAAPASAATVVDDEVTLLAGQTTFVDVLGNDTYDAGATLVVRTSSISGAAEVATVDGVLGINFTASETVNPTAYNGPNRSSQSVGYQVCEVSECTDGHLSISQEYAVPLLADDQYTITTGDTVELDVYANDQGFNGNAAAPTIVGVPEFGTATPVFSGLDYYTIEFQAGPIGLVSFTYQVCKELNTCSTAVVSVNVVGDPRTAGDDVVRILPDTPEAIYVHRNDPGLQDIYNPNQTLTLISEPTSGTAVVLSDSETGRAIRYTPTTGLIGQDSLVYESCITQTTDDDTRSTFCAQATVTIDIAAFGANTDYEDGQLTGQAITVNVFGNDVGDVDPDSITIITPPSKGVAEYQAAGPDNSPRVLYTASQIGDDSFTYEVCNAAGDSCSLAEAFISDTEQGVLHPEPQPDVVSSFGDGLDRYFSVLANDEGQIDSSTLEIVETPNLGYARIGTNPETEAIVLIYAVAFGPSSGTDTLTYRVCATGEEGAVCDTAQVTVEVGGAVNPVMATDDSISGVIGTTLTSNVAANDTNATAGSVELITTPAIGEATVNATGSIDYSATEVGDTSLTYRTCQTASDPEFCGFADVQISVSEVVLVANADTFITASAVPTELDVLANDEGFTSTDTVTIAEGSEPNDGIVNTTADEDGEVTIVYTSDNNFIGDDTFTYRVCREADSEACDTAVVTLTVSVGCTIVGTSGDDIIEGTPGDDVICALGGADTINAGAGNDVIYGNNGADTINAGAGNDTVYGGRGADTIRGFAGDDILRGGRGTDTIRGGADTDRIYGGRGADTLRGGSQADSLFGGSNSDTIEGGGGADFIFGGRGDDIIQGNGGPDTIRGNTGNDTVSGGANDDLIYGNAGNDDLTGNNGDDTIRGGLGTDVADGSNGTDTCVAETETNCEADPQDASPTIVFPTGAVSVPENQISAVDVEALDTTDAEGSGLSYSIIGGQDATLFTIEGSAGQVSFVSPPNFEAPVDADNNNVYALSVEVSDSDGLTDVADLIINVSDISEMGAFTLSGPNADRGYAIAVDTSDNTIITGDFWDSIDVDSGPGTTLLTSNGRYDAFVASFNPDNSVRWAHSFGGSTFDDEAAGVAVDPSGAVTVVGEFQGVIEVEPGPGTTTLSATGIDAFVVSYDTNGVLRWAHSLGADLARAQAITTDSAGNVTMTGYFESDFDADPGPGVTTLTSNGGDEVFVISYDTNGDLRWATSFGATGLDRGQGVAVANNGDVVVTGVFSGTVDFEPGPGVDSLTSVGPFAAFVVSYAQDGGYQWSSHTPGDGYGIDVDPTSGDVAITGQTLEPGNNTADIFVASFDNAGVERWRVDLDDSGPGNSSDRGYAVSVDGAGNVTVTGLFESSVDFDPGPAASPLNSMTAAHDIFLVSYDTNGAFRWANRFGGDLSDIGSAITGTPGGGLAITGRFSGSVDFDPGPDTELLTSQSLFSDVFITRYDSMGALVD